MKKILEKTINILITNSIIFGVLMIAFIPFWIALFLFSIFSASMILVEFLDKYVTIKNIKTLFKRLWFFGRYKNHNRYYFKTAGSGCLEKCPIDRTVRIGSVHCQECLFCLDKSGVNEDCIWIKCEHIKTKRSYNPLNWLKKLFAIIVISLFFSSCSVYVNCNINKVPQTNAIQSNTTNTNIQPNEYWF